MSALGRRRGELHLPENLARRSRTRSSSAASRQTTVAGSGARASDQKASLSLEPVADDASVVSDANKRQLAYVYYENEPGRRSAAKLLSKDEAGNIAKLPDLAGGKRP
jgi:hypothetical protein